MAALGAMTWTTWLKAALGIDGSVTNTYMADAAAINTRALYVVLDYPTGDVGGGTKALTLAANSKPGSMMYIVASGSVATTDIFTVTLNTTDTVTFSAVGDYVVLVSDGTDWSLVYNGIAA